MPVLNLIRHRLQRLSWIAALAIFGLAVVPTLSRALAHADAVAMAVAEVCTMEGMTTSAPGETGVPAAQGGHGEHCPLCSLSGGVAGLLPAQAPVWRVPVLPQAALPPLFFQAQRPLFAWASVQPRGPPILG